LYGRNCLFTKKQKILNYSKRYMYGTNNDISKQYIAVGTN
jgi:hypothetical protein